MRFNLKIVKMSKRHRFNVVDNSMITCNKVDKTNTVVTFLIVQLINNMSYIHLINTQNLRKALTTQTSE